MEEDDFVRLAGAVAPWAAGFQRGREEREVGRESQRAEGARE